jgi:hypothetical protein
LPLSSSFVLNCDSTHHSTHSVWQLGNKQRQLLLVLLGSASQLATVQQLRAQLQKHAQHHPQCYTVFKRGAKQHQFNLVLLAELKG